MLKLYILAFVLATLIASTSAQIPLPPVWPNVFAQDFVEIATSGNQTVRDVGTYYYDYANNKQRLTRSNGQFDLFCGFNSTEPLACDQVVVDDKRYIYFPELNDCCYCCGLDDGCAVLKPKWFINPQFLGETDYYGIQAYKWVIYEQPNQQGPNYFYETTEQNPIDRKTLYLARNNYQQNFFLDSFRTEFPQINLPEACTVSSLSYCPGVCAEVRGDSQSAF
ncbi:hypothetical protein ABPG74_004326 [Tetrahymena malaccensis]